MMYIETKDWEFIKNHLPAMLTGDETTKDLVSKTKYEASFQLYMKKSLPVWQALKRLLAACPGQAQEIIASAAELLLKDAIAEAVPVKSFFKKFTSSIVRKYYNTYLTAYTIPSVFKALPEYAEVIIDRIKTQWEGAMPDSLLNIQTYEDLLSGL